ncbi:MAG: helix-turn-helix transcriptional regulator [Alphaproteobacteria bacterium]|nr:helix-turn-helix transcriptional regulator [Alphaproteobacteria bacterium]
MTKDRQEGDFGGAREGVLRRLPPPGDLAPWVFGFVQRDDTSGGRVVVVLPETRASIQVMIGDDYWLREQARETWQAAPRVGFWGPRYNWAYGFAARRIKVFAVGFTPDGAKALTGLGATGLLDTVHPAERVSRIDFSVAFGETFEAWVARMTRALREHVHGINRDGINWDAALHVLATSAGGAIRDAAAPTRLSERQFRRLFRERYGVAPKQYQRVLRVDRLLRQLHPAPWEADALINDPIAFADQPHVIREFKAMTGMTPADYVRRKAAENDRVVRSVAATGVAPPNIA